MGVQCSWLWFFGALFFCLESGLDIAWGILVRAPLSLVGPGTKHFITHSTHSLNAWHAAPSTLLYLERTCVNPLESTATEQWPALDTGILHHIFPLNVLYMFAMVHCTPNAMVGDWP